MIDLRLGDCREILPTLAGIGAVVSDPPYGIAYVHSGGGGPVSNRPGLSGSRFTRQSNKPIAGDCHPFDPSPWLAWPCFLFGANHFAAALPPEGSWLTWDKSRGVGPADSFVDGEFAWCSESGVKRNVFRYLWKGVCQDGEKGQRRSHPTQKPVAVMRWAIGLLKLKPGATILDPYMGSGTTGVAAVELGFNFVGIEIDPGHFATAERRIRAARHATPLLNGASA